jgi:hypothetical protein
MGTTDPWLCLILCAAALLIAVLIVTGQRCSPCQAACSPESLRDCHCWMELGFVAPSVCCDCVIGEEIRRICFGVEQ